MMNLKILQVFLINDEKEDIDILPYFGLEITHKEYNSFTVFKTSELVSKLIEGEKNYSLNSKFSFFVKEGGKFILLKPLEKLQAYQKHETLYISPLTTHQLNELQEKFTKRKEIEEEQKTSEEKKRENKEAQTKQEESIRSILRYSVKDPRNFKSTFGELFLILLNRGLKLPNALELSPEQKKELQQYANILGIIHSYRYYEVEAEIHIVISDFIATCLSFLKSMKSKTFFLRDEFLIKPDFIKDYEKDIIRKVDCSIFNGEINILLCLWKIKPEDRHEGLRQNADQMRAYCISYNKKVCRGIATNGSTWYITQYEHDGERFTVSEPYEFLIFSDIHFKGVVNSEEFFGILMAYILDSEEFLSKNNY